MSSLPNQFISVSELDQLRAARDIVRHEAQTLLDLSKRLDSTFCTAVDKIVNCRGMIVVTGMGKAGLIGQKVTATLSSTGTRAMFLHPSEAIHGDLGCLSSQDIALALSNSGETEEIRRLIPSLQQAGVSIIAVTAKAGSTLGRAADPALELGSIREAGPLGLAPSATTTAMLALCDALALVVSQQRGFTRQQFALYHPGGSLGQQLTAVSEIMRQGRHVRIAPETATVREALVNRSPGARRTGAVMIVDADGRLCGFFTDSDLARLLGTRREHELDLPIAAVMTREPYTIAPSATISDAISVLSAHHISELPVVDAEGRPVGMIDITDLIGVGS